MRAIVFAGGDAGMQSLVENTAAPLLPLLDRPFLQHILEYLVDHKVHAFDFILSHHPEQVEAHFGDGRRWGCQIRYSLARNSSDQYRALQALPIQDPVTLLVHGDRLPLLPAEVLTAGGPFLAEDAAGNWTGWAAVPSDGLKSLAAAGSETEVEQAVRGSVAAPTRSTVVLSMRNYEEYLQSNRLLLDDQFPALMWGGRETSERIRISRNVSLHPTTKLTAPVFIGENCSIAEGAQIGPYAVIGRDSVLDRNTTVSDSVVLPGSYVGEELNLENSIVDRGRLVNVALGAEVAIGEEFLLGSLVTEKRAFRAARIVGRVGALVLLVCMFPVLLLVAACVALGRRGPLLTPNEIVRIPAAADPERWRAATFYTLAGGRPIRTGAGHLFLHVLPGLLSVVLGRISIVGVEPRSPEQITALPPDWRALYLKSKAGLITEAFVQFGPECAPEELHACEAYYGVAASPRLDLSILARYVVGMFRGATPVSRRQTATGGKP